MATKNKRIMVQGTASTVGKSILCTAFCRIFSRDGYNVNPFKSQNMSLNSYITPEGHEMGRAQVMQAEAAGKIPSAAMNPILLKPTSDRKSQVVINGSVYANMDAVEYFAFKPRLKHEIGRIYQKLEAESDIVVIEGAGSPAEINLNQDDFVNMGMAKIADAPVVLVGDIDKGGVFASILGTMQLLNDEDRSRIKGVIINKFRGSYELLEPGIKMLEEKIKVPVLGVVPYFTLNLEDEDSVTDWNKFGNSLSADLDVAVIKLPYMSNFTDFNALRLYDDLNVRFIENKAQLGKPDLIIIPGSKSTIADLGYLRSVGLAERIKECHQLGAYIFGICGGFQMLGLEINDRQSVETSLKKATGLMLLDVVTDFQATKTTTLCEGTDNLFQSRLKGYEIHMGETKLLNNQPFSIIERRNGKKAKSVDGAISQDRRVYGTYIHGIFDNSKFTRDFLNMIRTERGLAPILEYPVDYREHKEQQYNQLAQIVREHLDMEKIYAILEGA